MKPDPFEQLRKRADEAAAAIEDAPRAAAQLLCEVEAFMRLP
jgi:hypothetical protein